MKQGFAGDVYRAEDQRRSRMLEDIVVHVSKLWEAKDMSLRTR